MKKYLQQQNDIISLLHWLCTIKEEYTYHDISEKELT